MAKHRTTKTGNEIAIIGGYLFFEDVKQFSIDSELFADEIETESVKAIRVVSLNFEYELSEWVGNIVMIGELPLDMTLRKEKRGVKFHWYAYRRFAGKLHKRYVGTSEDVTADRLIEVAKKLPANTHMRPKYPVSASE